jgi:uncharacterized protein
LPEKPEIVIPQAAPVIGPVRAHERIEVLDILRGFAVFGILAVNMAMFAAPIQLFAVERHYWSGLDDRIVEYLIFFFGQGKFISLFSFLFGLGLSVQMARAEARGARFVPLYVRRLFVLLGIGLVHAFLIWYGDILVSYALFGFLLLLFRKRSHKTLLVWILIFALVPVVVAGVTWGLAEFGVMPIDSEAQSAGARVVVEQAFRVYAQGTFAEIMAQRAKDVGFVLSQVLFFGTHILAMFLLGLYAGRRRYFHDVGQNLSLFHKVLSRGLPVGLAGNLVGVIASEFAQPDGPSLLMFATTLCFVTGATALCLCYIAAITLLFQRDAWRRRLAPIAAVGRTALSNYLLQSVICTLIFYSYGLGLYGKVGPALGLLFSITIYLAQIALSGWWLTRYRFGPVEWLWRSLTYCQRQPMRV